MSRLQGSLGTKGRVFLSLLHMAVGTALAVVGSREEVALLVLAGIAVIVLGLHLLRPLAKNLLDRLDQQGL